MGSLWAAHLALSSSTPSNIQFLSSRPNTADKLSFHLQSNFLHAPSSETFNFAISKHNKIDENLDCILVCTKSFDTLSGLKSFEHAISPSTIIVLFQNGLGSQFNVLKHFPDNPIYAAVTTEGANKPKADTIIHAGQGSTRIGPLTSPANEQLETLKHHLHYPAISDFFHIEFVEDIWEALWQKLVINCAINPFTALLNCKNGKVKDSQLFKDLWPSLKSELGDMLSLAGYPKSESEIEQLVFDVMNKTSENISSMLQDTRAKKRTEINAINGFAESFLNERSCDSTVNHRLLKAVQAL